MGMQNLFNSKLCLIAGSFSYLNSYITTSIFYFYTFLIICPFKLHLFNLVYVSGVVSGIH